MSDTKFIRSDKKPVAMCVFVLYTKVLIHLNDRINVPYPNNRSYRISLDTLLMIFFNSPAKLRKKKPKKGEIRVKVDEQAHLLSNKHPGH